MAWVRSVLSFAVAGSLLGVLVVSLLGPRYIQWDNTPGSAANDPRCLCAETARQGADRIIGYQMYGSGIGALLGAIAGTVWVVSRRKRVAPASSAPSA